MKVLCFVNWLGVRHGGPSHGVAALTDALCALGIEPVVLTTKPSGSEEVLPVHPQARVARIGKEQCNLAQLLSTPSHRSALRRLLAETAPRIVHLHGIWTPLAHSVASVARSEGLAIVISPHGSLCPWALRHKYWKKRIGWLVYQRRALSAAQALHATAPDEASDLRNLGLRGPIAVIPPGSDLPPPQDGRTTAPQEGRTALFLSRIHPKKGLLNLVEAWSQIRPKGWRVIIAGPDETGHKATVERAIRSKNLAEVFTFAGPVYGQEKWDLYNSCDLFVLPSFSENFGSVVPEALACGLPVITTKGTPWEELATRRCGWWIDIGAEPLAAALKEATSLSGAELAAMRERGRALVTEKYSWELCAKRMAQLYRWVLGSSPEPDCLWRDASPRLGCRRPPEAPGAAAPPPAHRSSAEAILGPSSKNGDRAAAVAGGNAAQVQFHNRLATRWEEKYRKRSFCNRAASLLSLLDGIPLEGTSWLDAGCGTGHLSRRLAALGCSVLGLDAAPRMVEAARRLAEGPCASTPAFEAVETIERLPMGAGQFDGVLCSSVLEYLKNPEACVDEFSRVLRPGGWLLISVPNARSLLRRAIKAAWRSTRFLGPRNPLSYMRYSMNEYSLPAFERLIEAHGFTPVRHSFVGTPLPGSLDRLERVGTLVNVLARRFHPPAKPTAPA